MLNILLVDDDPIEFRLIDRMLKDTVEDDYVLRHALNLERAEEILKTQKTDIILLDDKLNNGRTALDSVPALKNIDKSVPMVIISSNIDAAYLKDKVILDVYDIVDKFHLRKRISESELDFRRLRLLTNTPQVFLETSLRCPREVSKFEKPKRRIGGMCDKAQNS
jgi:CheY-like chemotaxis protein